MPSTHLTLNGPRIGRLMGTYGLPITLKLRILEQSELCAHAERHHWSIWNAHDATDFNSTTHWVADGHIRIAHHFATSCATTKHRKLRAHAE